MTVSALLPVHVGVPVEHLVEALESLLAQTALPDEVVLVEDGPLEADQHLVIEDLRRRHPRVVSVRLEVNQGAGVANQAGLVAAAGEWIAKFDADDVCLPERIEVQLAAVEALGADVCGTAMVEFDSGTGDPVSVRTPPAAHEMIAHRMRLNNPVNHPTALYRRDLALAAGGYPPWRYMQDYGLMARMLHEGAVFMNLEEPLVRFRTDGNVSRRRRSSTIRQLEPTVQRELRDLGIIGRPQAYANLVWRTSFRLLPPSAVSFVSRRILARPACPSTRSPKRA
jgi:glycosyltransferase involved in cell wall biosynthesis